MDAYEEYSGQKSRGYTNLMYVNDTQIFKKKSLKTNAEVILQQ